MIDQAAGFIIYHSAEDYPGKYVCRRFSIAYNPPLPDREPAAVGTLKVCRAAVPAGLQCVARDPADPPAILETWL